MCRPADVPCCTSLKKDQAGLVRQSAVQASSPRPVVALRRAALALVLPAALLSSAAFSQTPPVTVEAAPVTASVARAITVSTSVQLGAPRVSAPMVGTVTTSALNLRTGPGTGYGVIAVLGYGTQGTVLGQAYGWYNIQTTRGTGWVIGTYFSVGSAPAPAPAPVSGVVGARATMVPNGQLISGWGAARSSGPHQGEDLGAPYGLPIYAPARLTILNNYWDSLGGWSVFGRDALGRNWYVCHMSSPSPAFGTVAKGQIIGYVGMTGSAQGTTPHLHYQVSYPGGTWGNPVDVLQSYPDVQ